MRSVSIAKVAEHAGVSVATVSRVLNGNLVVKESTRVRVEASIHTTGYRVNHLARSLRTDESRLLLAMVPDIGNPFYAQIVQGIDGAMQQRGYSLLLCETGGDAKRERGYFDLLESRRADGAICMDADTVQQALQEQTMNFPWVACCEFDPQAAVPYVGIDNRAAAREATACLIDKGHTRIAFLNSDIRFMYARERLHGYLEAMEQAGIAMDPDYCIALKTLDFSAGKKAVARLLALPRRPTAVFAVADTLAIGVLRGLHDARLRVPEDMAVMGFDDIALAEQTYPALSTVRQPMRALGEQAAYLLLKQLDDRATPVTGVVLPHHLVLRESA